MKTPLTAVTLSAGVLSRRAVLCLQRSAQFQVTCNLLAMVLQLLPLILACLHLGQCEVRLLCLCNCVMECAKYFAIILSVCNAHCTNIVDNYLRS